MRYFLISLICFLSFGCPKPFERDQKDTSVECTEADIAMDECDKLKIKQ